MPMTALEQNITDLNGHVDALLERIVGNDAREAALNTQITDLVAAANISAAEKAALTSRIEAAVAASQAIEDKARAGIPGVPPVGGEPLGSAFTDRASFDAAVVAYTGPEAVTLDATEVKAGTTPSIDFYSHSADGSVSTSGPSD